MFCILLVRKEYPFQRCFTTNVQFAHPWNLLEEGKPEHINTLVPFIFPLCLMIVFTTQTVLLYLVYKQLSFILESQSGS